MTIAQTFWEIEKKLLDYNHDKCIATQEFNKLTVENLTNSQMHHTYKYR